MSAFDARSYWEQRLSERYTLGGVGYLGLGEGYNAWAYKVRRHVFLKEVRAHLPDPRTARVLDIGSGTGFYIDAWHEFGAARVTGSDLTDAAVANLKDRHPQDAIVRFDIGGDERPLGGGCFDAVSMMDVLFHVVDDEHFHRAFVNAFELLEPGGVLVFSENFLHGEPIRLPHQASRTLAEIEGAVRDAGFEIVRRRPMFWLMNAPLDSRSRLLQGSWGTVHRLASRGERVGAATGAALYPLELALVARRREGPSTELMICRRPVGDAPRRASSPRSEGA
jgi:SAM-dependent methyltransferase